MAKATTRKKKKPTRKKRSTASRSRTQFAYAAAESNTPRRQPSTTLKSTDNLLTPLKRSRITGKARHLQENFSIAAWAIRRHLDYVADFSFQANTGDQAFDNTLEEFVRVYSRASNCDAAGRHSLGKIIRLAEERRTVDGDVFIMKLANGRLQAIESDRVRDPETNANSRETWGHGVRIGSGGRPRSIAVHKRTDRGTYDFERFVPSRNFWHLGYFERFDQVRGVSPLTPAIKTYIDVYEAFDFGKGPVALDLEPGDRAEFLEPNTPPAEFQNFSTVMIGAALKSLDIPLSMYDEAHTNYSGARSALIHYQRSVKQKSDQLRELLNRIVGWRIRLAIAQGELIVPASASLRFDWIPAGVPWFDPTKEIAGDVAAINAGLTTRSQVIKERHGRDFREVIDQLRAEQEYINDAGLVLNQTQLETVEPETEDNPE